MKLILNFIPVSIIFASILAIFFKSISFYFLQDDWFVLNNLPQNLIDNFVPRIDVIYYRPIGIQLFFDLAYSFFGLNHINFHILLFALYLVNSLILVKIISKLFGNRLASLVGVFVYFTSAFNFMALSWLVLSWVIIGTTFFFLALLFYLRFRETSKIGFLFLTGIFFLLALFSTEFALIFPVIKKNR